MNKPSLILTGIILTIAVFLSGLFIGKKYFATHEIKVITKTVTETKYKTKIEYVKNHDTGNHQPVFDQDNFNRLLACYESPLKFQDRTENNYLFVTAFDDCKEATARYEIGTSGNYKIYLAFGTAGILAGGIITYTIMRK